MTSLTHCIPIAQYSTVCTVLRSWCASDWREASSISWTQSYWAGFDDEAAVISQVYSWERAQTTPGGRGWPPWLWRAAAPEARSWNTIASSSARHQPSSRTIVSGRSARSSRVIGWSSGRGATTHVDTNLKSAATVWRSLTRVCVTATCQTTSSNHTRM